MPRIGKQLHAGIAFSVTVMPCCCTESSTMKFDLITTDGMARRGSLTLAHGVCQTPMFMPVGTYGSVKAMSPEELVGIGASIVLGNTFHLWLRPGLEVIAAHGGLHKFMAMSEFNTC